MHSERTEQLHEQGFDMSEYDEEDEACRVGCSQCEALVINGTPCHERGCPNQVREEVGYD